MSSKGFLGNMTENLQADCVQSCQADFIQCFPSLMALYGAVIKKSQPHFVCNWDFWFLKAIPHKDCATDASSNFSSDETKSGVNT